MEKRAIEINMLAGAVAIINACLLFHLGVFRGGGFEVLNSISRNVFYLFIIIGLGLHATGISQPKIGTGLVIAHLLGFTGCIFFLINPSLALTLSVLFFLASILISIKMFKHN